MDLQIREFSKAIGDFVNRSELPAEVKRLALMEIAQKASQESDRVVISQIAERDKEAKQKGAGAVAATSTAEKSVGEA